jgi:hypothetical protein
MLKTYISMIRSTTLAAMLLFGGSALAQTASGVINGTLINKDGISLQFDTATGGVALGSSGTSAASLNFGTISDFGPLSAGVTRPTVTALNYTVRTIFDVQVVQGGLATLTYTLTANLAAVAPTGLSYKVDAVTLTAVAQTIQINGPYNTDVAHNLDLTVLTAAPGAGGPAVGTPLTTTINFTATAN